MAVGGFRTRIARELLPLLGFLILPALLFWPVTVGGQTLLPFDNLYSFLPWQAFAPQIGITVPQNQLLGDLVLQNLVWKNFVLESLRGGELPLWNPYLFSGVPFLAAGQHSALYPLSIIYWLLPLPQAYGWFTLLHFFLAGCFAYFFLRTIGLGRWASFLGGTVYSSSLFMVVHVVFPMILGAVVWLPLILAFLELAVETQEPSPHLRRITSPLPYLLGGSLAMGMQFLAGHAEFSYYIILVTVFYATMRLGAFWWLQRKTRETLRLGLGVLTMLVLGIGLGAGQLVPLYELVRLNFRQAAADYNQIIGYAYPLRQIITFFVPDFFGNPSHHQYFDLFSRQILSFTKNFNGAPVDNPFWGIKNYVEAGAYIGILPLILATLALLRSRSKYVVIFAILALVSLLLVFGTALYVLPFYLLPGYQQLHTPFRWIFPYTLALAVLAAFGADYLLKKSRTALRLGAVVSGLGALLILAATLIYLNPDSFLGLAQTFLSSNPQAQRGFADGQVFLSYQWRNLLLLAAATTIAGLALLLLHSIKWRGTAQLLGAGGLIFDLLLVAGGFNPSVDPKLGEFTPRAISFLQEDQSLFRITTLDSPGQKILNPNSAMPYGLQDIRGYDSIILQRYTEFMGLIAPQGELIFNRIAPLTDPTTLDSPLLDLLNVKYVLTTQEIDRTGWRLVYDGELRIYENQEVLPRAFAVPQAEVVSDPHTLAQRLLAIDPREVVLLEEDPPQNFTANNTGQRAAVEVVEYRLNEVVISAQMPGPGWLVLTDSYFPGWQAFVSSGGESGEEAPIYRADLNFRAVRLPAGSSTVTFRYSPLSLRLGFYTSFLAAMLVVLGLGYWAWRLIYREERATTLGRVAKNSLVPMATSFLNKAIDFGFALIMLRILGPEGQGKYGFAIFVVAYVEIFTNFGLGTLLTREVAKEPGQANRYLSHTAVLRMLLLLLASPLLLIFILVWQNFFNLPSDTIAAITLLAMGLIPGNLAAALSSLFLAHEKMEYPAGLTTLSTVLKVSVGLLALLLGYGFVGLAFVSVVVNTVTMLLLYRLVRQFFFTPRLEFEPGFGKEILHTSYPLMINHLLASLFFRIDVTLLQPLKGDRVVGWYTAPYKILDGLLIIPSTFTFAIFPVISRLARDSHQALVQSYHLSLKWLLIISLPLVLLIFNYAEGLILILGGQEFLPHSAIALQLLIWFLPLSFINGLTQYVLIAVNQQAFLTRAFLIVFSFNLIANLILIPSFSYQASAVITVLSEVVLFLPFYYAVRKHITSVPWGEIVWRPGAAALGMAATLLLLGQLNFLILIPFSLLVYGGVLLVLGTLQEEERRVLRSLVKSPPTRDMTS